MASINDLLRKKNFQPVKTRSWDYIKEPEGKNKGNKGTDSKQLVNNKGTDSKQIFDKESNLISLNEAKKNILNLSGIQKKVFYFIIDNLNSNLETDVITTDKILNLVNCR